MRSALLSLLLVGGPLLGGCAADLGTCDEPAARTPYYNAAGDPAYGGQALMEVSCASGRCHTETAKGEGREGVPAGLDFDMVGHRPSTGGDVDGAIARLKRGQRETYEWRLEVFDSVEGGWMPPGKLGKDLEAASRAGAAYTNASDEALPKISSSAGKKMLKNWLACRSPVVEAHGDGSAPYPTCVAGERIGDRCGPRAVELEPTWASIYSVVVQVQCVSCHVSGSDQATESKLDLSGGKDAAYGTLVDADVAGDECASVGGKRVVPGDAAASNLIHKVTGEDAAGDPVCGEAMPGSAGLDEATVAVIEQWINDGAENN